MFSKPQPLTRDLLRLSGPDTESFLQGLVTTNVEKLPVGDAQHTALLTPQGKILYTFFLTRLEDETFLADILAGRGALLGKKLSLHRLRAEVDIDPLDTAYSVGIGPPPEGALWSGSDPRLAALPPRWLSANPADPALPTGDSALCSEEIRLGVPAYGVAYDEGDAFPLGVNLDLLAGIDHQKGCFVGQEVASRMFRKGDIRKRTWRAIGPGLEQCVDVTIDGRTVAMISAVDGTNGLALMRLDRIDGADEVTATLPTGETIQLIKPDYLT